MTRAVLLLVALLVPAANAGGDSFSPPPEAKAWLGTWKTTQGEFRFTALNSCASSGNVSACELDGTWDQPGGGSTPIAGHVYLGSRYRGRSWQGCYDMGNLTPGNHCSFNTGGDISLARSGDRLTDGYWKPCGLGEACKSHHPITGAKTSSGGSKGCGRAVVAASCPAAKRVRFSFVVDGFPDRPGGSGLPEDLTGVEIKSHRTLLHQTATGDFESSGRVAMTLTYVSAVSTPHVRDTNITIELGGGASYIDDPDRRKVTAGAEVIASDDENCPKGAWLEVRVTISGAKRALAFEKRGDTATCLSPAVVIWGPHRVKRAHISAPE